MYICLKKISNKDDEIMKASTALCDLLELKNFTAALVLSMTEFCLWRD